MEEHVLIGYGKDSKTYCCYHRATYKVVESKDKCEVPFRPGITQGLDEESIEPQDPVPIVPSQPTETTPNPNVGASTTSPIHTTPPTASTSTMPQIPPTSTSSHIQCSSQIPKPNAHSAEASSIEQFSAVQCTTTESIASKSCLVLDDERQAQHQSITTPSMNPSLAPPDPDELFEIMYKADNELSEAQMAGCL